MSGRGRAGWQGRWVHHVRSGWGNLVGLVGPPCQVGWGQASRVCGAPCQGPVRPGWQDGGSVVDWWVWSSCHVKPRKTKSPEAAEDLTYRHDM
jgi:hypothetical protein